MDRESKCARERELIWSARFQLRRTTHHALKRSAEVDPKRHEARARLEESLELRQGDFEKVELEQAQRGALLEDRVEKFPGDRTRGEDVGDGRTLVSGRNDESRDRDGREWGESHELSDVEQMIADPRVMGALLGERDADRSELWRVLRRKLPAALGESRWTLGEYAQGVRSIHTFDPVEGELPQMTRRKD